MWSLSKENSVQEIKKSFTKYDEANDIARNGANESFNKPSLCVASWALELGRAIENRGKDLDMDAIYYGAVFHDIGRVKSQDIDHAIEGKN